MEQKEKRKTSTMWRQIFVHNLGIKILSCLCAIVVWLLITNIADPYKTKTVTVRVNTIHEEAISAANMVYEVVDGEMASVTVSGKRSVVDKIDSGDIEATADLSELSSVNAVPVKVRLKKNKSSNVELECNEVLKIALEDMETKQIKVTVQCKGTPGENYAVGECVAKPNVIEVRGGESVIDRIETVEVNVNVNGATESFSRKLTPVAYNKNGNRVSSSTLSFNVTKVNVKVKILEKKSIPVKVQIVGEPEDGYELVEVTNSPENVEVAGNKKVLNGVSELVIPMDISGLREGSENLEQDFNTLEYLPEGITIPKEDEQTVSVKVTIEKVITRTFTLSTKDIQMNNVSSGYLAEIYLMQPVLDIRLMGRKSVISDLNLADVHFYVDCRGKEEGIHMLPLRLREVSELSMENEMQIGVRVVSEEGDAVEETASPTATSTPVGSMNPSTETP